MVRTRRPREQRLGWNRQRQRVRGRVDADDAARQACRAQGICSRLRPGAGGRNAVGAIRMVSVSGRTDPPAEHRVAGRERTGTWRARRACSSTTSSSKRRSSKVRGRGNGGGRHLFGSLRIRVRSGRGRNGALRLAASETGARAIDRRAACRRSHRVSAGAAISRRSSGNKQPVAHLGFCCDERSGRPRRAPPRCSRAQFPAAAARERRRRSTRAWSRC